MNFIDIKMNMKDLNSAKLGLTEKINTCSIDNPDLKELIFSVINEDVFDTIPFEKNIFKSIQDETDDRDLMGMYLKQGKLNSKILLFIKNIEKFSSDNEIDVDQVLQSVYLHELGHHVLPFTDISVNRETRRSINEGLANYFNYIMSDDEEREVFKKIVEKQDKDYKFYENFIDWEIKDYKDFYNALICLINDQQVPFLMLFIKYLLKEIGNYKYEYIILDFFNNNINTQYDLISSIFNKEVVEKEKYELLEYIRVFNEKSKEKILLGDNAQTSLEMLIWDVSDSLYKKLFENQNEVDFSIIEKYSCILSREQCEKLALSPVLKEILGSIVKLAYPKNETDKSLLIEAAGIYKKLPKIYSPDESVIIEVVTKDFINKLKEVYYNYKIFEDKLIKSRYI